MKGLGKSTVDEIRKRFDGDVERFSNLDTGQVSTVDAKLSLELITDVSNKIVPNAENLLDIGCGAGNYTLSMLSKNKHLHCTLVDLSKPMLDRAYERVSQKTEKIQVIQGDIRQVKLKENFFDIILAGTVLHHLRDEADWESVFFKLYKLLKQNGCLMISDMVTHDNELIARHMWERYGGYLEGLGGKEYRQKVMAYVEKEDSPRSIGYQTELMRKAGFKSVEILHKNLCFGTFCGIK
jgi:tRNA (cmo5U34)-methyltransferase